MGEMEDKIGAILNDPNMMQQLMSMAQALGTPSKSTPAPNEPDLAMIQKFSSLAQNSAIDSREKALLNALGAYLSTERITKLEKAMRAAKIAQFASSSMGQGALLSILGR